MAGRGRLYIAGVLVAALTPAVADRGSLQAQGEERSSAQSATFTPGDYVIRAIAPDGTLITHHDISVKVSSGGSATLRQ